MGWPEIISAIMLVGHLTGFFVRALPIEEAQRAPIVLNCFDHAIVRTGEDGLTMQVCDKELRHVEAP